MTEIVTLPRRSARPCFVWLLPAWFAVLTLLALLWPGRGFQLFGLGALPGVWASLLLDAAGFGGGAWGWFVPSLLAGVPIVALLGHRLDRLDTEVVPWLGGVLLCGSIAGYLLLQRFSDLDEAVAYHGSLGAFAVCALQLGGYGATLLWLTLGAGGARR